MQSNKLDYEMESHKPMNGDTVRWQIESKQNPIPKMVIATEQKGVRGVQAPGCNSNGLQHGTRANVPTDGDTTPWQILDVHLCRWFPSTQKEFWGGTSAIGSSMKFWFQPYIELPNPTLYVARASVLVKSGSGIWGEVEVELDMDFSLVWTS
jgi:hypothetical protein